MLEYIGEMKKRNNMEDLTDAKKINQRIAQELAKKDQTKKINLKHDDWLGEVMGEASTVERKADAKMLATSNPSVRSGNK